MKSRCSLLVSVFLALCTASCTNYQVNVPLVTGAPFGYAQDRCRGGFNQCRTDCLSAPDALSRSACDARCLDAETQCYATGEKVSDEPLSQTGSISAAQREAEKEQAWREFKARKERERAAAKEAEKLENKDK